MSTRQVLLSCVALLVLVPAQSLHAQPAGPARELDDVASADSSAYRSAIARALQEYELHNYAEAREQFRVAHELEPSARTLRGLGLTEFELRNYPESVAYLEQALASDTKPLAGEMRTETQGVLDAARGYVGELAIELRPHHATVTLDGQPLELSSEPVLLPVGDHVLEFSATGRATQRRTIKVKGRQHRKLEIELVALPALTQEHGSPLQTERPAAEPPLYRRWWLWTTVGVVVAAAGVTSALLVHRSRAAEIEERPTATPNVPDGLGSGLPLPSP